MFEGIRVTGMPDIMLLRGHVIVQGGFLGEQRTRSRSSRPDETMKNCSEAEGIRVYSVRHPSCQNGNQQQHLP